jgi:hypothetical protein
MQAKALRSAVDSGLEVPPEVIDLAIKQRPRTLHAASGRRDAPESEQRKVPGPVHLQQGGRSAGRPAMAAAGVVCLQEFGQYDDWRIPKNMDIAQPIDRPFREPAPRRHDAVRRLHAVLRRPGAVPGRRRDWRESYPRLRDYLVNSRLTTRTRPRTACGAIGRKGGGGRVGGKPGELYGTSVACFILAIPNRYLPILQEGKIEDRGRRYRVVEWAAMDFLREALQRNRRILQIRDLLLAPAAHGGGAAVRLALAQPFFAAAPAISTSRQPLHAVMWSTTA